MRVCFERRVAATRALAVAIVAVGVSCTKVDDRPPAVATPEIVITAAGDEMVLVPAGTFRMGSADGEPDQRPVHEVQLDAFLMDRTEVTQEQYTRLVMVNGSNFKGPDRPAEMIAWAEAALFCNMRSRAEGLGPCYDEETAECNFDADGYRLPTEAEWEYACRAGEDGDYAFGSDASALGAHAWYKANAGKKTHPVAQKKANVWGLCDMHGNVAEWCNDVYDKQYYKNGPGKNPRRPAEGEKYVLRGGAWNCSPEACRAAHRVGEDPGFQDACFARDAIGFRCVRKAPADPAPPRPDGGKPEDRPDSAGGGHPAAAALAMGAIGAADPAPKTGFVHDDVYLKHDTGRGHPERPVRLTAIVDRVKKTGMISELVRIEPRVAAREWLLTVHSAEHVARIERASRQSAGHVGSLDTGVSKESYGVALQAAGGVLAAVDAVMQGKVRNAFCAVRPPGHHATRDRAMGFCLFNNVAIAARYLQKKHRLGNILIVDWDVHHGNGTQAIFRDDPTVFYFSVHQYPFYPGTGGAKERGQGAGLGATLNVPLASGAGDREFQRAFRDKLVPAAGKFKPDFVLVSAGFDAHKDDPLGGMKVTAEGFAELTRIVKGIAEEHCRGRLVSVLEGGYGLPGLADSAEAHLRALGK